MSVIILTQINFPPHWNKITKATLTELSYIGIQSILYNFDEASTNFCQFQDFQGIDCKAIDHIHYKEVNTWTPLGNEEVD